MPSLSELELYERRRREERGWTIEVSSPTVVVDPDTVIVLIEER